MGIKTLYNANNAKKDAKASMTPTKGPISNRTPTKKAIVDSTTPIK